MHGKDFKELNSNEILELINRYVDQNRYEDYPPNQRNKIQQYATIRNI